MKRTGKTFPIERLRELFSYDSESGEIRRIKDGKIAGSVSTIGYRVLRIDGSMVMGHRVAWAMHFGEWPLEFLDHIDRDRLNNRIGNLRQATYAENSRNRPLQRNSTSGYKGVFWHKNNRKWVATIKCAVGQQLALGSYDCKHEAAHAYNKAAIALHGDYAVLNPVGTDKEESQS